MVKSNFQSIDELFDLLLTDRPTKKHQQHLAFIILDNNKIPWTWFKEKMAQYLFWNMQGGVTGAGSGHTVYFYKDLQQALTEAKANGHTHAMVCKVGMLLSGFGNQVTVKTPIQNFYEFSESDEFMRAHILAHPNKPATIHPQHLEINLTKWNGKPVTNLGSDYQRSEQNIHDDYTPLWIKVPDHPTIINFTPAQRSEKWFLYPHRDYEKHEQLLYDYLNNGSLQKLWKLGSLTNQYNSSNLFIKHCQRKRKRFYYENNEILPAGLDRQYDVIIAPTAGLIPEFLYDKYGHKDTKVIIYDYDPVFLEVKQNIIDCGFVGEDLLKYMHHLSQKYDQNEYIFSAARTPNQSHAFIGNKDIMEDENALRIIDKLASADYEMKQVNMLTDNFDWIEDLVKDKSVLCYTSNIFKYYVTWLYFDTSTIKGQHDLLEQKLSTASHYNLFGRSWQ